MVGQKIVLGVAMEVIFNVQPMPIWDWRVAADLFFGGMGVGAFLFALLADWHFQGKQKELCRTAAQLSPILVVLGLMFLLAKLGRPWAFFHLFGSLKLGSPIWWGGWLQTIFVAGALLYAYWWQDESKRHSRTLLGWALSPVALAVGAYHGFLLAAFEVRALWSTGATVSASMLGFVTTGMAVTLVVHLRRSRMQGRLAMSNLDVFLEEMHGVRNLLGVALFAQLFVFIVWWMELQAGDEAAQTALTAANHAFGPLFWVLGIGLGLVLPLLFGVIVLLARPKLTKDMEVKSVYATSAMILVGGFVIRWGILIGGQADSLSMTLG